MCLLGQMCAGRGSGGRGLLGTGNKLPEERPPPCKRLETRFDERTGRPIQTAEQVVDQRPM
ncbi:hypothetical protein HMPREF1979_02426 [Actinomyces johnsonii F0542]|uniref:Uncharacterized protein n=1 Tax=Actinomyces johnsonii F0542 TaxID=1321818 RepID=U1RSE4_9ACTO|nr:hypothetical protein HMPREF1979_02426 [Actinomyces johnsonii F0542]